MPIFSFLDFPKYFAGSWHHWSSCTGNGTTELQEFNLKIQFPAYQPDPTPTS
jgi:hypothetical protein